MSDLLKTPENGSPPKEFAARARSRTRPNPLTTTRRRGQHSLSEQTLREIHRSEINPAGQSADARVDFALFAASSYSLSFVSASQETRAPILRFSLQAATRLNECFAGGLTAQQRRSSATRARSLHRERFIEERRISHTRNANPLGYLSSQAPTKT